MLFSLSSEWRGCGAGAGFGRASAKHSTLAVTLGFRSSSLAFSKVGLVDIDGDGVEGGRFAGALSRPLSLATLALSSLVAGALAGSLLWFCAICRSMKSPSVYGFGLAAGRPAASCSTGWSRSCRHPRSRLLRLGTRAPGTGACGRSRNCAGASRSSLALKEAVKCVSSLALHVGADLDHEREGSRLLGPGPANVLVPPETLSGRDSAGSAGLAHLPNWSSREGPGAAAERTLWGPLLHFTMAMALVTTRRQSVRVTYDAFDEVDWAGRPGYRRLELLTLATRAHLPSTRPGVHNQITPCYSVLGINHAS